MAHRPSSTASKKKGGGNLLKPLWDRIKRPKSPNTLASPSDSNRGSIDSASGDHDSGLGNIAGRTEETASGKFIEPISVLSTRAQPFLRQQCHLKSEYVPPCIPSSQIWQTQPTIQILPPRRSQLNQLHRAFQICWVTLWVKVILRYAESLHPRD